MTDIAAESELVLTDMVMLEMDIAQVHSAIPSSRYYLRGTVRVVNETMLAGCMERNIDGSVCRIRCIFDDDIRYGFMMGTIDISKECHEFSGVLACAMEYEPTLWEPAM